MTIRHLLLDPIKTPLHTVQGGCLFYIVMKVDLKRLKLLRKRSIFISLISPNMSSKINRKLFVEAYSKYSEDIFRYCYSKVSNREKAKDLLQDTFTSTWWYMDHNRSVRDIKSLLYIVANNLISTC